MKDKWNILALGGMMLVFAISRWPGLMPNNFSAAYALAFCAGIYFPKKLRWALPLGTMLAMDVLLNIHYGAPLIDSFTMIKLVTFAVIIWVGTRFTTRSSWPALLGGGILSALLFYLFTNFASWIFDPGYQKSLKGLIQALTTGLPGYPPTWSFLKNTLLSGGLFTGLFVGSMKACESLDKEAEESESPDESPAADEPLPEEA